MFTSRQQLIRKSGKKGVDRFEFLQELVNEFYQSASLGMFLSLRTATVQMILMCLFLFR